MTKKLSQEVVIRKFKEIHGDKYDYSKVKYYNMTTKVCIICPIHGEFWQYPQNHIKGHGCSKCYYDKRKSNTYNFINKSRAIHGNKYDYSEVEYSNCSKEVRIICPEHGAFLLKPSQHLSGVGCPICSGYKSSNDEFIRKAIQVHGNKYDYSKIKYDNSLKRVCIICPKHGEFWQAPSKHLNGHGCPKCGGTTKSDTKEFIEKAKSIHGDKYEYSLVDYKTSKKKVKIICPKHGEFFQTPDNHLRGKGCPYCSESKGEQEISKFLDNNNIGYIPQYDVDLNPQMFSRNKLRVDFYIPSMNTFIEFNGIQHYQKSPFFHKTEDDFLMQVDRDKRLKQYCKRNKIKLIVIKYNQIDKINEILTRKLNIK